MSNAQTWFVLVAAFVVAMSFANSWRGGRS